MDAAGLVALVTVVLAFVAVSEFDAALFDRGGFLRTGLVSAVVILAATPAGDRRLRALRRACWAASDGARTGSTSTTGRCSCCAATSRCPEWLRITLCLALTFTVTEVSYCWLETPIRRGGLRTAARVLRLPRPAATGALAAVTAGSSPSWSRATGVPTGVDGDPATDGPAALAAPVAVSVAASGPDGADAAPPPAAEP